MSVRHAQTSVFRIRVFNAAVRSVFSAILVTMLSSIASIVLAQNPQPVQTYFIPMPEDEVIDALSSIYPGSGTCGGSSASVSDPVRTTVSIAVGFDDTLIYYDQWEDGVFDPDIANPVTPYSSPGNLSGTQIWGDGDASNGSAPGYPGDTFLAGDIIILENDINTGNLSAIDFDARDKIGASSPIAVTRAAWANGPGTLLAGAIELYATARWGTSYQIPVGEDTSSQNDMFEYTGLVVMAAEDGTTVNIDIDGNGIIDSMMMLDAGESYHVDGGLSEGATVMSTEPVQVHLVTGDICAVYETRWFTLLPTDQWSDDAYTPVSSNADDSTYVFAYNPGPGSITVMWETTAGTQPSATIAAGESAQFELTDGSGAHFFTTDGSPFFAIATIDSEPTSGNATHDWGFAMIPGTSLTEQALVGWGPGKDPTQSGSENAGPVWVIPVSTTASTGPFDICVDYNGDGAGSLTDPFGNNYDELLQLDELEQAKVLDSDGDQTGMILYVCDSSEAIIAVAWGQDPDTASGGVPAIDVGTSIPPLPALAPIKSVTIANDLDNDGRIDQGDTLEYSILVQNVSRAPAEDVVLEDTVPANTTYVPNSTEADDGSTVTPIPDSGVTPMPLDEGGAVLPDIPPIGEVEVTFEVTVDLTANVCGVDSIVNEATVFGISQTLAIDVSSSVYCNPDVHIEKSTNGFDADTPTGPFIVEDDPVTWLYVVTNPGDAPLANVTVTDDQGVAVTARDADADTFNDGDSDEDNLLDVGESWLFDATGIAELGQYANIGTVVGEAVDDDGDPITDGDGNPFPDPTDDDPSHYFGVACLVAGDCDDGVACTVESCVANVCQNTPSDALCSDGAFCNGVETCDPVNDCQAGSAPDCNDNVGCTDDSCNEATDQCDYVTNDSLCSDGAFCNGAETCDAVNDCEPGTAPDCNDGVGCTDDSCNETTDSCDNIVNHASCGDALFCNGVEVCDPVNDCQAGAPPDCDDGIDCTTDVCNENTNQCNHATNDALCSDNLFCTGIEVCDLTNGCEAGTPVDCDDGVTCTDDLCDPSSDQCTNVANDVNCSDGLFCNGFETCDATNDCQAGTDVDCSGLSGACLLGTCDDATDMCTTTPFNDGGVCDDGDVCTVGDFCDSGTCLPGSSPCGDGDVDVECGEQCDPPNGVTCDDDCIIIAICGDGVVEGGEECDPPSAEVCNDLVDNDGDLLPDCADPDCQTGTATCGADCLMVPPPQTIYRDPATIKILPDPKRDQFKIHGRVPVTPGAVDPVSDGFGVVVSNENGAIYTGQLGPGDLVARGKNSYTFVDKEAKKGTPIRDGLARVRIKLRYHKGQLYYHFNVRAYSDLTAADRPTMTTQISGSDSEACLTADWRQTNRGWQLKDSYLTAP